MSAITRCPTCFTQFVVNDAQLHLQQGKVRCGQCMGIFNATEHFIGKDTNPTISSTQEEVTTNAIELTSNIEEAKASQDEYFGRTERKKIHSKPRVSTWLLSLVAVILILVAIGQSVYFLRSQIASYYPSSKKFLVAACENIDCEVNLLKKIDLIVIDDFEMKEDSDHPGLIYLSCNLINQANFSQALPNLELTLTDSADKPKLSRLLTPAEYLFSRTNFAQSMGAGERLNIKLPLMVKDEVVSGYRININY